MPALDVHRLTLLRRFARFCAAASAAGSAVAVLGWILRWPALENILIGRNPVHFLLALGLLLASLDLTFAVGDDGEPKPGWRRFCFSCVSIAIGAYTLSEYVLGRDVFIDRWLPQDNTLVNPRLPGHMTFMSALTLTIVAGAIAFIDRTWKSWRPSNAAAALAWALAYLALLSHFYGTNLLTGGMDMAVPSALLLLLLSSGALAARPSLFTRLALDPGPGGIVARRFLPATILIPPVLGWLRLKAVGWFPTQESGTAALVVSISAVFVWLVVSLARRIEVSAQAAERLRFEFEAAVANVKDYAIFLLDPQGHIQTWNAGAQAIKGWTAKEIVGRHFSVFYPPEDRGQPLRELEIAARTGRFEEEGWRLRKDGSRFWADVVITAVKDYAGQTAGFVKVTRDMTRRREAETALNEAIEKLRRSNEELEQFAYVASHDLQEPLRKVTSFAQLFARRYAGKVDTTAAGYINYIVDGAQRMQNLIADLLAFSRLNSKPSLVEADLGPIAEQAKTDHEMTIKEAAAVIEIDPLPRVTCDPERMLQLFENLLDNALKFRGQEPPKVRISSEKGEGEWVVSVADNGIGIDSRYHQQIFVMFRRLHSRSEFPGTGIGLAICKRVVEQLGGRIWVESAPQRGATFRFTIPAEKTL